jgi:hypothetical protein
MNSNNDLCSDNSSSSKIEGCQRCIFEQLNFLRSQEYWDQKNVWLADREVEEEVPISTDTAIVFSNNLPHRFMAISNKTKEPRKRIFINFFVVDPDFILSTEEEKLD